MLKPEPSVPFEITTRNYNVHEPKFDWYYNPYPEHLNDCYNITSNSRGHLQNQLPFEQISSNRPNVNDLNTSTAWHPYWQPSSSLMIQTMPYCLQQNNQEFKHWQTPPFVNSRQQFLPYPYDYTQGPQLYPDNRAILGNEIKQVMSYPREQDYQDWLIEEQKQCQHSTIDSHKYFLSAPVSSEQVSSKIFSYDHESEKLKKASGLWNTSHDPCPDYQRKHSKNDVKPQCEHQPEYAIMTSRQVQKKPSDKDPLLCERKPYEFLSMKPIQTRGASQRKSSISSKSSINPSWSSNSSIKKKGESDDNKKSRGIYHPRINHMIKPKHPNYLKLLNRRSKVSPNVWMHKSSCAVSSKGKFVNNNWHQNEEGYNCSQKINELIDVASKFCTNSMLEYLTTDWETGEKNKLPVNLEPTSTDFDLPQKLFRLKYIIHRWKVGPETEFDDIWVQRAMLCFSGNELKQGISWHNDWWGLTDVLRSTISLCKGAFKSYGHKLWVEHDFMKMVDALSLSENLGVNLGDLEDDLSYDDAPESIRIQLLKLVDCEVQQKKSWWERGVHLAYVYFTWPEGMEMGNYHVIFDVNTCEVVHKWQYRFRKETWEDFSLSKGRLLYAGDYERCNREYKYERQLLQAASKELDNLHSEVMAAIQSSSLYSIAFIVMKYWGFDWPQQVYRALQKPVKIYNVNW